MAQSPTTDELLKLGLVRLSKEIKTVKTSIPSATTAKYTVPIYVLEVGQTATSVPADFPVGGLIFQKTA
jgi:hypothetical protein